MAIVVVGWDGSWSKINETTRDDSDFIKSHILPLEEVTTATMVVGLTTLTDPTASLGHTIHVAYKKDLSGGRTIGLTVELLETLTTRATATFSNLGSTWKGGSYTLTAAEADSISDYSLLRFRFTFTATGTGGSRAGMISYAKFEAPSA